MRRLLALCLTVCCTTSLLAKDVYLSIAGTVNNFRTDARIFNPSSTKDITVQAYFLPVGNTDNSSAQPVSITVPKRTQKVLDDVVTAVFNTSGIGAIRLSCADDFVATSRIYAQTAPGTLGQFVEGLDSSKAKKTGSLLQVKSNASFRTNIGAANPNNVEANVTWRLYDKNNAVIGSGTSTKMPPFAVIAPSNIAAFLSAGSADISDAWVSFTSDQPIFAYVSVVDNGTTDPTYIPAGDDSGAPTNNPAAKSFDVTLRRGAIVFNPVPNTLGVGDVVSLHIHSEDLVHGFELVLNNTVIIPSLTLDPGTSTDRTFTVSAQGKYQYFCTNTSCSPEHTGMVGEFTVGNGGGDGGDPRGY